MSVVELQPVGWMQAITACGNYFRLADRIWFATAYEKALFIGLMCFGVAA
jgi:hypothetical protein